MLTIYEHWLYVFVSTLSGLRHVTVLAYIKKDTIARYKYQGLRMQVNSFVHETCYLRMSYSLLTRIETINQTRSEKLIN